MDSVFAMLREMVIGEMLDPLVKVHLIELVETRSRGWKQDCFAEEYYMNKCTEFGGSEVSHPDRFLTEMYSIVTSSMAQDQTQQSTCTTLSLTHT